MPRLTTAAKSVEPASGVPPTEAGSPAISAHEVTKVYGHTGDLLHALDRVSVEVARGEFVCLLGASGCGKSTLLNLAAGLDQPTSGTVEVRGNSTLMFQESALFPWLTVRGNVELPLRLRGKPKTERHARADELLAMVNLDGFTTKLPHELSGGMRQRVSLARALAQDADVLLMDEPFGALDAMTRDLLHDELERLWREQSLTILFVTHNVREAVRLGDRVVLLSSRPGRVMDVFDVGITRPRRIESHEVADAAAEITDALHQEVRRHGQG